MSLAAGFTLEVGDAVALEASCRKMQSGLSACQSCLRQFSSFHPVEREPFVTGCRRVMSLGGMQR